MARPSFGGLAGKAANLLGNTKEPMKHRESDFDLTGNDSDLIDLYSSVPEPRGEPADSGQHPEQLEQPTEEPPSQLTKEDSSTSQGFSKTSFTTANGDGLTFDPFSLNIFDEIALIIEGRKNELDSQKKREAKEKEERQA